MTRSSNFRAQRATDYARRMAFALLLGLPAAGAWAQAYSITEPSISACTGAFLDSGGEGASGYSDNESFVSTICSDQPGQSISLTWITFHLSTEGSAPSDRIVIYDGPDVNAPVIGTYAGNNSPGVVSASFGNTSGCLTIQFTSNETGTGVFAATISCYVPCQPPLAVATMNAPMPNLICQNEVVSFNGSGSTPAPGRSIAEYRWDFADGTTDNTSGPQVQHSWAEPGEYVVQLTIVDDIGCESTNQVDLQNWVSTTPEFQLSPDQRICQGESAALSGSATAVTWVEQPHVDFGDGIPLPDNVGETFSSQLTLNIFEPGASLVDITQLQSICVDMEHTYMGDLVVQIICPNGQTTILHEQGGGSLFLGDANDADDVDPVAGTCWHYCFSPTATSGTWEYNSDNGNSVQASQGPSLPPGTYESLEPLSQLVGCPLNGTWTFNITDLWGADNGFLCSWDMTFDPALYPDLTEFTPVLGIDGPDSASWSGPQFATGADHLSGTASPTAPGTYEYVLSVTDNFGCTYRDTTSVTVTEGPTAAFSADPVSPQLPGVTPLFSDGSTVGDAPILEWHWDFGNGEEAFGQNGGTAYPIPGEYPVMLTVTDANGCTDSLRVFYIVRPGEVVVPNVFSPNGDGKNDFLEFTNVEFYKNAHVEVFNRWGQKIYENFHYKNNWNAPGVSEGTYFFILNLEDGREWTGHVTILR